jgi:hypothetical protein
LLQFAPVPILGLDGSWGLLVERIEFLLFFFSVCFCLPLCFQVWVGEGLLVAALVVVFALVAGGVYNQMFFFGVWFVRVRVQRLGGRRFLASCCGMVS